MRRPRKLLLLGLLMGMAAVCWTRCCGSHLRRWRRSRAAAAASSVTGQMRGCCTVLVGVLLSLMMLAVPAVAAGPASVTLTVQTLPTGTVRVTATVTDARGAPVPDVSVIVRAKTTFGWLKVTEKATDPRGQISAELPASSRFEEITAEAGDADTVQAAVHFERGQPAAPTVRPGYDRLARLSPQPGFISPYPAPQMLLLGVILGGIWATYGYIVSLLVQIRRAR